MGNTFPFQVNKLTDVESENPYHYIQTSVGDIDGYPDLFEQYGFSGNGYSQAEHIQSILNEKDPSILEQLEFDEEGDTFLVRTESEDILNRFMDAINSVFGTKKTLKKYLSQADPDSFEEQQTETGLFHKLGQPYFCFKVASTKVAATRKFLLMRRRRVGGE